MVDKNLFAQDRKPPSPETAAAPAAAGKPGMPVTNIQLDGVMIKGNSRKALVRMKASGGPAGQAGKKGSSPFVVVRENQQVGDFRVVKIEPKSISLERDGQHFVVSLFAEGKIATPAAPPPAPAQRDDNAAPPGQNPQVLPPGRVQRGQPPQAGQQQFQGQPAGMDQSQAGEPQAMPQPPGQSNNTGGPDEEDDED